jgi:hypothetical protein
MRYVAIPLLILALIIGGGTAALIVADVTLGEVRDFVIIIYGVMGILFFLISIIVALGVFIALRAAMGASRDAFEESVKPGLDDVRGMVHTARGSVEFVADSAVSPVIRVVAVARGVRRGLDAVTGFARRER